MSACVDGGGLRAPLPPLPAHLSQRTTVPSLLVLMLLCSGLIFYAVLPPSVRAEEPPTKLLSVPAVVNKVRPSVVTILTRGIPPSSSQHSTQSGSGSGIIIDENGYVLTNNHLVQGVKSVVVGLSSGRLIPGRVVAHDFLLDLALIKITAPELVAATLSRPVSLEIGETVVAIGNPLALKGGSTVTVGVVSALDRSVLTPEGETLYDLIQTDAAINPGNSGGPLVDLSGRVVGINVAIAPSAQAISYAISMDAIYPHMESMIVRGAVLRPELGFVPLTVTPSVGASFDLDAERGILALQVDPSKPAGQAGLQSGDVITSIDSRQVFNVGDFWHVLLRPADQSTAQFTIQNKNGSSSVTIPKPSHPQSPQ